MRAIATWECLCAEARQRWPVVRQTHDTLVIGSSSKSLTITMPVVSEPTFARRRLVVARTALFSADCMPHETALQLNDGLTVGALAIRQGVYELRRVVDLSQTSFRDLDSELGYLAQLGEAIKAEVVAEVSLEGMISCFGNYLD